MKIGFQKRKVVFQNTIFRQLFVLGKCRCYKNPDPLPELEMDRDNLGKRIHYLNKEIKHYLGGGLEGKIFFTPNFGEDSHFD